MIAAGRRTGSENAIAFQHALLCKCGDCEQTGPQRNEKDRDCSWFLLIPRIRPCGIAAIQKYYISKRDPGVNALARSSALYSPSTLKFVQICFQAPIYEKAT